jgi:uncharacterized protein YdaU (DUF1376 family)
MEGGVSQDHYMPWFVGDFMAATATWTGPERGLYLQLLGIQWTSGPLPCDLDRLALVLHYDPKDFRKLWPAMASKFTNGDGRLTNTRLEEVRERNAEIQSARAEAGRRGGQASGQARAKQTGSKNEAIASPLLEANAKQTGSKNEPSDPIRSGSDPNLPDPSKSPRGSRARRSTGQRLPEDWILTPERQDFARSLGLDPVAEFHQFRDYWLGVPGSRGVKADWDATWRNSCRRSASRPTPAVGRREEVSDMVARLRRQADEAGEPA